MSKTNYYYDETNELHPFTIEMPANENSISPLNALRIKPEFKEGYHPCEKDGEWLLVEDNRGRTVYSITTKSPLILNELGAIPNSYTILIPNGFFDKWDGSKWIEDVQLKTEYIKTSNQIIINNLIKEATTIIDTFIDAIDLGMAKKDDNDKLKQWRKYRVLLNKVDTTKKEMSIPKKPD